MSNIDTYKILSVLTPDFHAKIVNNNIVEWYDERPKPTKEQIETKGKELEAEYKAQQAKTKAKEEGIPYTALSNAPISFTKDDAIGMLQVKAAFELGLPETIMKFKNGTELAIKSEEFLDFAKWFAKKRNEFFV